MPGLEDLYREIILDHYRSPRNKGELPVPPAHKVEGFNPLCGDEVVLYLEDRFRSESAFVGFSPQMRAGTRIHQLHRDPQLVPGLANAALHHITCAQFFRRRTGIGRDAVTRGEPVE